MKDIHPNEKNALNVGVRWCTRTSLSGLKDSTNHSHVELRAHSSTTAQKHVNTNTRINTFNWFTALVPSNMGNIHTTKT